MITLRKRIMTAGTPAIFAAIVLAGALTTGELLAGQEADAHSGVSSAQQTAEAPTSASSKGDLKVDLADVSGKPMRCVTGYRQTTCTGWPVTAGMLAYKTD